jgi:hypothetical protein
MGRQVVEHDPDRLGLGEVDVDEVSHAVGEVLGRAPVGGRLETGWRTESEARLASSLA